MSFQLGSTDLRSGRARRRRWAVGAGRQGTDCARGGLRMSLRGIPTSLAIVVMLLACPTAASALPDGRAIELVSPIEMNGSSPGSAVPAANGETVDYQAGPFADAANGGNTLYQARRTASGWETTALTPADVVQPRALAQTAPLFSTPDLTKSIFTTEQPLASTRDSGALSLYEESAPGALTLVSQGSQTGNGLDSATFEGATPDDNLVAFGSAESLVPPATGLEESGFQPNDYLYIRNVSAGITELVDVNGEGALLNAEGAVLGNGNDLVFGAPPAPGEASTFTYLPANGFGGTTTDAIAGNGSKVFFESPTPASYEVELRTTRSREIHLYMRKEGKTTVQLDQDFEPVESGEELAGARYMGASENGEKVFFLSDEGLAGVTFRDPELYMYDTEDEKLTPISVAPAGAPAVDGSVYGVVAIANDGLHVYYVAKGRLATNENATRQSAAEGEPNLYVYDTVTGTNTFITQLSREEVESGSAELESGHAARLTSYLDVERPAVPTPNGEVLVFVSRGDLSGENSNETAQVYRYDAGSQALKCISCGPTATGSASIGINVEGPGGPIGGGSYDPPGQSAPMNSTGERIFFETESALAPEDLNTGSPPIELNLAESKLGIPSDVDVYEWENGHVYLISAGQPGLTRLQGVTPSGNDAFFTSSVSITGVPRAGEVSLYDARVGGGLAPAQSHESASCKSIEGCQGVPPGSFVPAVPGTSILDGVAAAPAGANVTKPAGHGKTAHGKAKKTHKPKSRRARKGKRRKATKKAESASKPDKGARG
jgi:hypothetical protein